MYMCFSDTSTIVLWLNKICLNIIAGSQLCGLVRKAAACNTIVPYWHQFKSWRLYFCSVSLMMLLWRQWMMIKAFVPLHLHGTCRKSFWLLASPGPLPALFLSSFPTLFYPSLLSLPLPLYNYAFQMKKKILKKWKTSQTHNNVILCFPSRALCKPCHVEVHHPPGGRAAPMLAVSPLLRVDCASDFETQISEWFNSACLIGADDWKLTIIIG